MSSRSSFHQALRISGWYLAAFLAIGAMLFAAISLSGLALPVGLFGTLMAAKIGFVSLLTAVVTFLHRTFWDETKPSATRDLPKVVKYYSGYFLLLFGSTLATIFAIFADFVTATGFPESAWKALSLAAFSTAIILLVGFLLYFVGRVLAEMRTLLDTSG